ncbi:hypothetical protein HOD20_02475, partial [archaeon]|nr:hypothetical protein [archaeon]
HVYDTIMGVTDIEKVIQTENYPDYDHFFKSKKKKRRQKKAQVNLPQHYNLIKDIQKNLPAIFFVFSRKETEKKAEEASKKFNFLTDKERREISELANELISPEYRSLESIIKLKAVLNKGIAFHHAGVLPRAKELVEVLFAKGMIKILYATETFAVGINMPAKSVCFSSVYKYDGINFRNLFTKEYFQMAGRAGRRGIDDHGDVYIMLDRNRDDFRKIKQLQTKDIEPILSQFRLTYNTVINMMGNYDEEMRNWILAHNFYTYQRKKEKASANIKNAFNNKVRNLEKLGFIEENKLTTKGLFARRIYDQEILVTELFTGEFYKELTDEQMVVLCAAIIYEFDRRNEFDMDSMKNESRDLIKKIGQYDDTLFKYLTKLHVKKMYKLFSSFAKEDEFKDILNYTNLAEGDLIRLFRRTIDLMRQIRNATEDIDLEDKCSQCIRSIQKTPIKVEF